MAFLLTKPKFPFFQANSLAGAVLERQRQALQIQKLSSSIQKVLGSSSSFFFRVFLACSNFSANCSTKAGYNKASWTANFKVDSWTENFSGNGNL